MATAKQAFTARETELLTIAFQCLKQKPDIDYTLFAQKANLKGAKSARDSFGPLYNKIVAGKFGGGDDIATGSLASSPAKGSRLKRKGVVEGGDVGRDDDDEDEVASPLKKAKKTATASASRKDKGKGKGKKAEEVEDEDVQNGEEVDGGAVAVKAEVLDDGFEEEV